MSHQGYVHKLLTGRNDKRFDKIRQSEGLSGFLSRDESQHDAFGAGHAGTALSAALGRCMARDLEGRNEHVVAVAGDAAFTCGITLEALNNIACSTRKVHPRFERQRMVHRQERRSLLQIFQRTHHKPRLQQAPQRRRQVPLSFSPVGDSLKKFLSKAKRDTKELLAPSSIFEKLGIRYVGPIDGHGVNAMTGFFEFAKTSDEPIVLHLLTQKEKVSPSLWKNLKSGMAPGPSILRQELRRKQKPDPRRNIRMCSGNA